MRRLRIPEIVLGFLFATALWAIVAALHPEARQAQNQSPKTPGGRAGEIAATKSVDDGLALYTLWLAIFTGCLVAVSGVQGIFLYRSDQTARRTADAALMQARAAIAADSPIPIIHEIKLVQYEGGGIIPVTKVADPLPPGPIPAGCRITILVGNEGRLPMQLAELCIEQEIGTELPPEPSYQLIERWHTLIRAGDKIWLQASDLLGEIVLNRSEYAEIEARREYLWVYGYVGYHDLLGIVQRHRFLVRWDVYQGLVAVQRPNYT